MRKKRKIPKNEDKELRGLKGWLILVTFILVTFTLTYFLLALIQVIDIILGKISSLVIFWLLFSTTFSILFGYCLYLEFKYKKEFPVWFIALLWISAIFGIFIGELSGFEYGSPFAPFNLIVTIIWTLYFIKSKRVKNTFTK